MKKLPIFIALCAVIWPFFSQGFFVTDDGNWMIIRLSAFYQSLAEGQFPVRFLGRLNYSYGYPVSNFLYPGFLYVGSLIHYFGFSFVDTTKILITGSLAAAAVFLYLWLRTFFRPLAASIGSISFLLSPYIFFDIYKRGSVGELYAMPWAALALYSIGSGKKVLFPIALSMLIIGHNSLALLLLVFFIIYLIAAGKLKEYMFPLFLGVGLAAFFWFPAIYEQQYVRFNTIQLSIPKDYFLRPRTYWFIGLPYIFVLYEILALKKKNIIVYIFLMVFIVGAIMASPVSAYIWREQMMVQLFQFPFRFLILTVFAGSWLIGKYVEQVKHPSWHIVLICMCFGLQAWFGWSFVRPEYHPEGYYTTNEATTTVADEYLPMWVTQKATKRASARVEFHQGSGSFTARRISTQYIEGTLEAASDGIVQINTLYYPGWGVTVDGLLIKPEYENSLGVMQFPIEKGTHQLVANFRETVPRFIADIVSGVCSVLFILYALRHRSRT